MAALEGAELDALIDYWRCANYLTVAQIYLQANPLLREPLTREHIKPRLLGHWGTSPGLSLVYVQLNRLIRQTGADVLYVAGPGHGGPALVANTYLEGSYSELFPEVTADEAGLVRLVRQFSTPGGIPSHASVTTPGSIHEGGELGYALVHAFGAAFDHPDLLVACVVGDGEAETGPLAGSWKSIRYLNPARDGAVLPILHLNGYKIASATVLGRRSDEEVVELLRAEGYEPHVVAGTDPHAVHQRFAEVLEGCYARIREIQADARSSGTGVLDRPPAWPAIVLRTPKGWTGPEVVDGVQIEGTFRAHQVPLSHVREDPGHLALLEAWLRSYAPERHFDERGRLAPTLQALAPDGDKRMGMNPYANGGRLLKPLDMPAIDDYAVAVEAPGALQLESTRQLGGMLRDIYRRNPESFRLFCPDETASNRLQDVFEVSNRCLVAPVLPTDDHLSADGRVMEVLSEHLCEGWLEGYLLTGRHGLFATYEAFAMVSSSMTVQHAKWLQEARRLDWREPVASLNVLLTSTCWRNDHNGFSHQGPGLIDTMISLSGVIVRVYLPPDANCLLSVAEHAFASRDYVNLIVSDKQPQLQYLDMDAAREHCARGASEWAWAGTANDGEEPDVVIACAGDVVTMEALAAAELLRLFSPDLEVRFVNVVDLMALTPPRIHPHGLPEEAFARLFGESTEVVFAFHGYARALHQMLHGRRHPGRFHVHGFTEQGTTTTPFDMVVLNEVSRYHLALHALAVARRRPPGGPELAEHCQNMLERHHSYVRAHFEDMPEVSGWRWNAS
jgi:xylulose-5-phosphate/fructose-6-phosphate phosphoketolase